MDFNKESLLRILKTNFGYKISDHPELGKLVELDARTAYKLCLATNSYYLLDKYGTSLFGRFITFNHRDYSLLQGLFLLDTQNTISDENIPHRLAQTYPFIFSGKKHIIFVESSTSANVINSVYEKLTHMGENPENYIINVVSSNGAQWEHYFEFIASEYFIKKGFITDIQLPWNYHGRPDFGIYNHELINLLRENKLISDGCFVPELSALRIFGSSSKISPMQIVKKYQFFVGEVKTKQQKSQILSYLKTGICVRGYEFIPNKKVREEFCGLIHIDADGKIKVLESGDSQYLDPRKLERDVEWFDSYLKINLLGNLTLDEIHVLIEKFVGNNKMTFTNLIKLVKVIDFESILEVIKSGVR